MINVSRTLSFCSILLLLSSKLSCGGWGTVGMQAQSHMAEDDIMLRMFFFLLAPWCPLHVSCSLPLHLQWKNKIKFVCIVQLSFTLLKSMSYNLCCRIHRNSHLNKVSIVEELSIQPGCCCMCKIFLSFCWVFVKITLEKNLMQIGWANKNNHFASLNHTHQERIGKEEKTQCPLCNPQQNHLPIHNVP